MELERRDACDRNRRYDSAPPASRTRICFTFRRRATHGCRSTALGNGSNRACRATNIVIAVVRAAHRHLASPDCARTSRFASSSPAAQKRPQAILAQPMPDRRLAATDGRRRSARSTCPASTSDSSSSWASAASSCVAFASVRLEPVLSHPVRDGRFVPLQRAARSPQARGPRPSIRSRAARSMHRIVRNAWDETHAPHRVSMPSAWLARRRAHPTRPCSGSGAQTASPTPSPPSARARARRLGRSRA